DKLNAAEGRRAAIDELDALTFEVNVSPEGRLYGSISAREIAEKLTELGYPVEKSEVDQPDGAIRETGEFNVGLILHADVSTELKVVVLANDAVAAQAVEPESVSDSIAVDVHEDAAEEGAGEPS
ncbi:MAG: 50S ribosomal protein L9, partial [Pseudomonadota bacterium]